MLVLTRKVREKIVVGDGLVITVVQIAPGKVRLGIECAKDVLILREELLPPDDPRRRRGPAT